MSNKRTTKILNNAGFNNGFVFNVNKWFKLVSLIDRSNFIVWKAKE